MKKIIVIGASGSIGQLILPAFLEKFQVITAGRKSGDLYVDISSPASIRNMFKISGQIDHCICVAGDSSAGSLSALTTAEFSKGIRHKLTGQANLVRIALKYLNDGGSVTLTSGKMGDRPVINSAAKAIANGGINSFVRAAALEMHNGIRINAVSPTKISDLNSSDLVNAYMQCVIGSDNGSILRLGYLL
jgi:NAD(P)-dependent dehydrogenase (short-subunit alcohol dehydrogenase family)